MFTNKQIRVLVIIGFLLLALGIGSRFVFTAFAQSQTRAEGASGINVPYSGQLTGDDGKPVVDGLYDFAFTLYNTPDGGNLLWSESQIGVSVQGGVFTVVLGSINLLPASSKDEAFWLGTSVRGPQDLLYAALAPRQQLSAVMLSTPFNPTAAGTCAHNHVGEVWTASVSWSNAAFRVNNSANGPSIWGWNTAGGNGVRGDGWGSGIGVYGEGENSPGVVGRSANGYGVEGVSDTGSGGVYAHSTNGYGLVAHSDTNHSIFVDGAGQAGVYVASAGWAGVVVWSAATSGIYVQSATHDGVLVDSAGWDGVHVVSAGGSYYGSGLMGAEDFLVLNTGEVRSKVGFATPSNGYAVMMPITGAAVNYEDGAVVVLGNSTGQSVALSSVAYSPTVIGVYSATPGFVSGQPVPKAEKADGIPITILGIVPVKVNTENGPIRAGDLLVTSSTAGYAMRGDNPPPGTILGKALESFEKGSGVILVLLMLQ
jgi:hypothetical protein